MKEEQRLQWVRRDWFILLGFILLKLLLSLFPFEYGIFRDEFYYLSMSNRLDFGYVDVPPLAPLLLAVVRFVFGDSYFSLHLLPAVSGTAFLILGYLLMRKMGGNVFSQILLLTIIVFAPYFVAVDSVYTYDTFNKLFWLLYSYLIIRLIQTENLNYWLLIGIVTGFGLLFKITLVSLVLGWMIGLLFTANRQLLFKREMLWGGILAFIISSPYLFWQVQHQFVTLDYMGNYSKKISEVTFWRYIVEQNFYLNPVTFPLWLGGLYYVLFHPIGKIYRSAGIAYLFLIVFSFAMKVKADFILPYYVLLIAAGCIWLEGILINKNTGYLRPGILLVVISMGIYLLPMARPILPVETFIHYYGEMSTRSNAERKSLDSLPQFYADRFGWEEITEKVARVYHSIPEMEQEKVCIVTRNYGEAGGIEYYGKKYDLPLPALSGHNQYYIWGPGGYTGEIVIAVGFPEEDLRKSYGEVTPGERLTNLYMMPYEKENPIYLCRNPIKKFQELNSWFKWLN